MSARKRTGEHDALNTNMRIFRPRQIKKSRELFEELPGNEKQKAVWVFFRLGWRREDMARAISISVSYVDKVIKEIREIK